MANDNKNRSEGFLAAQRLINEMVANRTVGTDYKRTASQGTSSSAGSGTAQAQTNPNAYVTKRLRQLGLDRSEVNDDYISSFLSDAQKYANEGTSLNARMGYNTSSSIYNSRSEAADDLRSRSWAISRYLEQNKDSLPEEYYTGMRDYLDNFDRYTSQSLYSLYRSNNFYSQFESEDDYNQYASQQADYEAKVNLDLDEADEDIAYLERVRNEYDILTRTMTDERGTARLAELRAEYGELSDLDQLISERRAFRNQASHIQEGITLASVVDNDDFKENSGYVSTYDDGVWSRLTSDYGLGYKDLTYEYINNQNGIRDEIRQKHRTYDKNDDESVYEARGYDYLTEDEIAIYNYYYARDGKEAAENYLDSIQESLNLRKGTVMASNMEDKNLLELAFGVAAGIDQFKSGLTSLVNTEDDYIAQSAYQIASGMVREDLGDVGPNLPGWLGGGSLGQMGYDAVTTTANMAPSIMTSMVVGTFNPAAGAIVGNALMGGSAAGNAYQEMLNLGYDKDQARSYSTLVGASEATLQYLLGGIGNLGGKLTGNVLTNMMSGVDNAFLRVALSMTGNMLSEGLEEGLQEILTPWFKNLIVHAGEDVNWSEVAYSTLLGMLTAGVMEGPQTVSTAVNTYRSGRQLQDNGITAQRLSEIGNTFSADTVAYQLAGRVNENTGAYTMGRLFNEIGATLTEQNVNEITEALVNKGMDRGTAYKNARAMAVVVEGGNLTDRQVKTIEANEILAEAVRTTIIDSNATWFQRTKGYKETLMALARENVSRTNPAEASAENAPASDKVDTENKAISESLSEADTGPAKVQSISSIKDGQVTIKLEDGSEVNVKEADLDPDDGVRIETIASIDGISAHDADFILSALKTTTGASAQIDSLGAKEAYRYGFYGFSQDHITKHGVFANSLTATQRQAIYELGQNARQQQIERNTPKKSVGAAKQTGIYFDNGGGDVVSFNEANKMVLSKERTAGVQAAMVLRKLGIGGDIYFFESYRNSKNQLVYKDKNGKEVKAPNGWYSEMDGSIHIDLNAGTKGQGYVLFTLAHELTHFIEQWSPSKYKVLADFLVENYEKGQSMDSLVRAKQKKLSDLRGEAVSYSEAYSEVVADSMEAMLADGNVMQKLVELKAKDHDLVAKMKQFFDNLAAKIRNIYKGLTPDSVEGKAVLEMKESIEKLQQLFAEALVEASENFQSAMESVVEADAEAMAENEIITEDAVVTDGNGTKYSIRSMKHDIAEGQMFEDLKTYCGWTQKQVTELRNSLEDLVEYMTPYRNILDMNETYDREGRRFSPYKPNSDPLYKISMDFSTLCSKRLLTQYVIENLQLRENRPMSAEEQMAIRDMLNEYRKVEKGLQVACAMCYVEAARLKSPKQISKWMTDPETQMRNYFADKNPEFAAYIKDKQSDFKEARGYARNATKKDMSAKDVRELNKIRPRLRSQYQVSAEEAKIIARAKALPNSTYLTAANLASLSESDPIIYSAYTAFVRTATRSKSLETDEPYYYGDSRRDNGNGIVVTDDFIEAVNRENGMRFSSWSDWRIQHLLDYITAVIDNSVRGAAMHGYTKFGDEVRVLGKTGMMFNMSGVAGTQTGLNEDGSLSFSPTESIDVNEAIQLRDEFPDTAGLQCIGVGDDHIIALLRSDIIDYVIPYHVSGLNAGLRTMVNIHGWKDYTTTQHAAIDKSIKLEDAVDKEHWHEEPVYSEFFVGYDTGMTGIEAMRASADRYIQMCKDRGLKPKFEQFVNEDNYWKLLIDRKMINQKTGKLIQQKAVTPAFDFDAVKAVVDQYVQNYDSGMEARALNHIVENWDSIPKRIRDLKKQGGTKAKKNSKAVDTLANQTLAAQPVEDGIKQSSREEAIETSDVSTKFSIREEAPPKKVGVAYKVFLAKDGQLYPPMVANPNGEGTPVGVWLNADIGKAAAPSKTGRPQVQGGGKGTNSGKISLAFRPGWHLGDIPLAKQFAKLNPETGQKELFPANFVWAECEYAMDVDYQEEAMSYGYTENGKFRHSYAGLPKLPTDGYYRYRTNPNPDTVPWVITGAMRVKRILTDAETDAICRENGVEPMARQGGPINLADFGLTAGDTTSEMGILYSSRDVTSWDIDWDEDNNSTIKSQMIKHMDEINMMNPVATIEFDKSKGKTYADILDEVLRTKFGYKIERADGASFLFDKVAIATLRRYVNSDEEAAAVTSAPYVLKRGKAISGHKNHKKLGHPSVTYAGPVVINGEQVNVGVVVLFGDKSRPHSLRVLMPSGKEYVLKKTETDPKRKEASPKGAVRSSTGSASNKKVTQPSPKVKRNSDRDTESVSDRSLLANAFEGVAKNEIERNKIQEYKGKIDLINAEEQKLRRLNDKIKELSFAKGPKDTKRIRNLQFEARETANRISVYDKQLLRLEASRPLQDVLTREKEMVRKREQQRSKDAMEAYRERATKTQRELLDRWQESRKRGVENRQKTAMRHKIKGVVNDLNQYLLKGTKERHVPIGLQKAVAEALNAVNMDTVGAEERIAKLQAEMMKAKTPDQIQEISRKIDHIQEMGDKMGDRLRKLKEAYDEFINSDDPLIANAHDDGLSAHMMTLIVRVGDTPLRDMSLSQLEDVYDVYTIVLATIRKANKSFADNKKREISVRANQAMAELDEAGGKRGKRIAVLKKIDPFFWNNMKPVYAFETIGSSALTEAFNNVRAGEDVWAKNVTEARAFYLDKAKKYQYDSWDFDKKYGFTSTSGLNFELTLDQIMSLYAYSKRAQADEHLEYGGFVFDPNTEVVEKTKSGIKVKYNVANATAYNLSKETVTDIVSKLTPEQKGYADEMQAYLSDVMGAKGNEVSLAMYDIKLFKEKHYFPLKSATQYMARAKEQAQGEVKVKNSGFSKNTMPHAKNPIVLSSFMDVWANHVNDMSMYHAFVLPMEDFYRIYNYTTPSNNPKMPVEGVNPYLENAFGSGVTAYIDQLLKDLNGGARTDSTTGFINKAMGLFKKGAVFASASVVVQQPSAIARAAALVDMKYFIGPKVDGKRHKELWAEVKEYAPVAIIKEMGYFDTNMGKSTQDFILGKEYSTIKEKAMALVTDSNYRDEVLSKAPALADEIAWCGIWEAVKRETNAKYPDMDVKSSEFLKKAGERFTEVIVKTQVYDSVLARSANMRSKDTGMKMATAFMAEPTTSINMVADALLKGKRGGVEGRRYCRKAIGAVVASQILNSFLVAWVYAARDDDEDESFTEKWISQFVSGVVDGLNPLTYIPFIKDVVSIVQGYDVERSDMAVISDLWNAWKQLKNEDVSVWRKVENFAGSIFQIFGLPVKNIMRDLRAVYQAFDTIVNGENTTAAGIAYAVSGALTGKTVSNKDQLYDARVRGSETHAERVAARYEDEDAADSAVRSAIRERFLEGEIDAITARNHLITYAGMDVVDAHWLLDEWTHKLENESDDEYNKYDRFYEAVQTGSNLRTVIQEYTANGVDQKTLRTQITEHFKPMYIEMSASERAGLKGYLINALELCGKKREDAVEILDSWDFEAKNGFAYSDRKSAYLNGDITAAQLRQVLIETGGYSEEDADAQIEAYDWEKQGYENVTAAAIQDYNEFCAAANVPKDIFLHIRQFSNNTENDVDEETGRTIYYSAMKKVMAEIDAQPGLTPAQKTAIARSLGWSEKNIDKYKLW